MRFRVVSGISRLSVNALETVEEFTPQVCAISRIVGAFIEGYATCCIRNLLSIIGYLCSNSHVMEFVSGKPVITNSSHPQTTLTTNRLPALPGQSSNCL